MNRKTGGRLVSALLMSIGLASGAAAETRVFILDGNSSTLKFSCDLMGVMPIAGAFTRFVATISIDPSAPGEARAVVRVDASSIVTDDSRWLDDLKSEAFFDVERHPEFGFTSYAASLVQPGILNVRGNLTLRGITHPVTLRVRYTIPGTDPAIQARIEAVGEVDRTDFGMTAYQPFLSNDVEIEVEGRPSDILDAPVQ